MKSVNFHRHVPPGSPRSSCPGERAIRVSPTVVASVPALAVSAAMAVLTAMAALALLAAGPAVASDFPASVQWVLSSAKVTAAFPFPTYVTSLRIVNPNAQATNVYLTYLPQSPFVTTDPNNYVAAGDNGGATSFTRTVDPGQTLAIEDAVATLFGDPAPFGIHAGGIQVVSDLPVSVFSRTYVANAQSSSGVPGTFGISVPSVVADLAVSAGDTAYLPYGAASPSDTRGFRSNLIMLNTVKASSVVHVKLLKGNGTTVGERDYTFAPLAQAQQNLPDSFGFKGPDENLTVVVTVKSGGPVAVGLTPIDNAINSPIFTGPSKVFAPNNGAFAFVLDDGGYGFSGRFDIESGQGTFLSAGIVLASCPTGPTIFFVQAFSSGSSRNTTFTRNADGSWTFSGGTSLATWNGQVRPNPDGTILGTITYQRAASASCGGVSQAFSLMGARAATFSTTP